MPRKGLLIVFKETRGLKRVRGAMEDLILDKDPREHRKYIWGGGVSKLPLVRRFLWSMKKQGLINKGFH